VCETYVSDKLRFSTNIGLYLECDIRQGRIATREHQYAVVYDLTEFFCDIVRWKNNLGAVTSQLSLPHRMSLKNTKISYRLETGRQLCIVCSSVTFHRRNYESYVRHVRSLRPMNRMKYYAYTRNKIKPRQFASRVKLESLLIGLPDFQSRNTGDFFSL